MSSFHVITILVYHLLTISLSDRENILLILVDDLGNSDASFNFNITHSHKDIIDAPIPTPNIDYLAHSGIILSNHYTHWFCGPSRCALLSSRYSFKLGNPFETPPGGGGLDPYIPTFAHELKKRNYRNSFIGKWGIDVDGRYKNYLTNKWQPSLSDMDYGQHGEGPIARGFDNFYGLYYSEHDHFTKKFIGMVDWHIFNETHMMEDPDIDTEPHLSSTHIFVRETILKMHDYINPKSPYYKQPFFIHLSLTMPHDPLQVDDKYINLPYTKCVEKLNYRRRKYCGMVQCVDEGIGNITKFMKKHNLLSNTIITFTSDNGGTPNFGGFNYPFRGTKASSFQGGVKTPGFIYAPNIFSNTSKRVYDGYMHLIDYGPTLLSLIDANNEKQIVRHSMGDDIDGIDLSHVLKDFDLRNNKNNTDRLYRNDVIVEHNGWANMSAYISGDYKLVLGHTGSDKIWIEPDGGWNVHTDNATFINYIQQIFNYILDIILPNDISSGMQWCFLHHTEGIRFWFDNDSRIGGHEHEYAIDVHPDGKYKYNEDIRPLYIPYLNWWDDKYIQHIRLYNIKDDPSESNNIAMDRREKTIELFTELKHKLIAGNNSVYSYDKSHVFHNSNGIYWIIIQILLFLVFLMMFCIFYCVFKRCKCKSTKTKTD